MKKNKNKQQSNPTLTELLEPYLRNPPSPPQSPSPQSWQPQPQPQPKSLPSACLHTVQKGPTKPWRQFNTWSPQFYHVHPSNFRDLVQRLTGESTASNENKPPMPNKRQVDNNQNTTGIVEQLMPPAVGTSYVDLDAPSISWQRAMGSLCGFTPEKNDGESSDMGPFHR